MKPVFFKTPADFRDWLERNHASEDELLVGFYKRGSGKPSITWPESVDQALCFGWIDGVRKNVDEVRYTIRFTPRRKTSVWSSVNVAKVKKLQQQGLMQPAGLKAFEARKPNKTGVYSYENRPESLPEPYGDLLKKDKAAMEFFMSQANWYRRALIWWVISAKKEETRIKRLNILIQDARNGRRMDLLTGKSK